MTARFTDDDLRRYVLGDLERVEIERIDAALEADGALRDRLERQRRFVELLRTPSPGSEDVSVLDGVRAGVGRPAARRWPAMVVAAAVVAVVMLFVVRPQDEFRAKSAGDDERRSGVFAYVVPEDGEPQRLEKTVASTAKLGFAYHNDDKSPYRYLMIFAVGADREVYWYYPAYVDAATDPAAVSIERGVQHQPLPDSVRHELPPGPLVIHALFMPEPRRVSDVERAIRMGRTPAARGVLDQHIEVQVQ